MDTEKNNKSELAQKEEKILKFWKEKNVFQKTLEKASPKGEFIFYEGPPTANAAPAIHHLESRAFKDVIPRYKTMQGYHVRRKAGWDTHGLPVELQIEKKLGLTSKKQIEEYGIAAFNKECRESVWGYMDTWTHFTERIGYWVDSAHPYVTYHNSYMESVWYIVSHVNDRKLLYKDYKVVPWCPRCGTALSSHELAQGYADVTDLSVYVKFKVVGEDRTYILAWTTTPWTLPGNVGLAVGNDIEYVKVKMGNDFLILAQERLSVLGEESYEIIETKKGSDLVGLEYEPIYPFLKDLATGEAKEKLPNAWKVYPADFVTTTDGTGVVHTAVMYGQDDFELGSRVDLPKFHLVQPDGTFIPGTGFLEGKYVRNEETTVEIIKNLAHQGLLFKKEKYKHSYPHCWRCKTALIYYARDSWYIRMSQLRGELQKENEKINWEPEHIKEGRFGEWLREAKDWAISRERYWGTPLPIWENESGERVVVKSIEDLKARTKRSGNTYYVMRHGQADNNIQNVISIDKHNTHHLTELGRTQVEEAVQTLKRKGITKIIASPFIRTRETLDIVLKGIGLSLEDVVFDDRISEFKSGENNTLLSERHATAPSFAERFSGHTVSGENLSELKRRMGEVLYETENKYQNETILFISHEDPIWALFAAACGAGEKEMQAMEGENAVFIRNAEIRELPFVSLPHDENYELDLHRPYIDEVILLSETGEPLTRVKEVMDVWFDSGSMPFAQDHYPFENKAWVDGPGYPADFISEAIDQTRGWFYLLLAVGVLMGRGTPYKNVICLGHILDAEGKKMSKSIGNIVNPWEQFDKYGVDALRLWMYSVNQPGDSKNYDEKTVDELVKKVFNPLTNVLSFFAMYEHGVKRIDPYTSKNPLDMWILARLNNVIRDGSAYLDNYKLFESSRLIRDFVQDLSTWYLRRSRDRFKSDDLKEQSDAVSVTEYVLTELSKYIAPFAPFYAEWLYQEVTKGAQKESVHMETWPMSHDFTPEILTDMDSVRSVVSNALELRQKAGHKVRQPLALLTIPQQFPQDLLDIIADEVNVKEVRGGGTEIVLDTELTQDLREEGIVRDIIRGIQDVRKRENLHPSDVINITVFASQSVQALVEKYAEMLKGSTQTAGIHFSSDAQTHVIALEGETVSVSLVK